MSDGEGRILAVSYVRMSTDHQKFSPENQLKFIEEYAVDNNIKIIEHYIDKGKSGLHAKGRDGFLRMISTIENGLANFSAILVYDVSRWGRFIDSDQASYFESICKQNKISVHYCAEQFVNDGSMPSNIFKMIKQNMASEYSRELSKKVFAGQCNLIRRGYKQGGAAGYGLRRMLIDEHGNEKGILRKGQHKSFLTDRVVLVSGPEEELINVRRIYDLFIEQSKSESEIAAIFNAENINTDLGRGWTRSTIHQVLSNEKYIGNNVFNRTSFKLKMSHTNNPPDEWVRAVGVFDQVISIEIFNKAKEIIRIRNYRYSEHEMLEDLSKLYKKYGYLSGVIIDEANIALSSNYKTRFGSLLRAYKLVGFEPDRDYKYIEINKRLRVYHSEIVNEIVGKIIDLGTRVVRDEKTDLITISEELTVSVVIARHLATKAGLSRWKIRFDAGLLPDITIAVRMKPDNANILDYYIFPRFSSYQSTLRLSANNKVSLDAFRFDDLSYIFYLSERVIIEGKFNEKTENSATDFSQKY